MDDASSVFDASILTGPVSNPGRRPTRSIAGWSATIPPATFRMYSWRRRCGTFHSATAGARTATASWPRSSSDWTVTGVLTLQSGVPIAVTQANNAIGFAGFGIQRPNLIGDPTLPADERSVSRWFDTSAFAAGAIRARHELA